MDFKSKYLKYKHKYQELSKQFGGAETIVPTKLPKTYSFLFMPLIYFVVDRSSVQMIDGFENIVNECITNTKSVMGEGEESLPFDDFESFIVYLGFILSSNEIKTLEDIEALKDHDHHINGTKQEIITNYRTDDAVNFIISCLANMLVERHSGEKFVYLK